MNKKKWLILLAVLLLLVTACSKENETTEPNTDESGARAVSVAEVVLRPMAGTLTASGLLVPREEATVGSELSGFRVAEVPADEGMTVKKGDILVRLDPGMLLAKIAQAEAAVAQAKAKAAQARAEAARVKGLDGTGILSDEQIGSRRSLAKSEIANVRVAEAQLRELHMEEQRMVIRAPVSGLILERTVRPGDVASATQSMFLMARDGLIELDAEIPEDAMARIYVGEAATVTLPSGSEIAGVVRLISPRVDPQTKLGRVRVSLPLAVALRPGGYGQVVFSRIAIPVPAVPEKAVQFEAAGPLLVVIDQDNRARRVAIKTEMRADGFVAIDQGPPVGTRVALGGGAFLLDGDLVDPISSKPVDAPKESQP